LYHGWICDSIALDQQGERIKNYSFPDRELVPDRSLAKLGESRDCSEFGETQDDPQAVVEARLTNNDRLRVENYFTNQRTITVELTA